MLKIWQKRISILIIISFISTGTGYSYQGALRVPLISQQKIDTDTDKRSLSEEYIHIEYLEKQLAMLNESMLYWRESGLPEASDNVRKIQSLIDVCESKLAELRVLQLPKGAGGSELAVAPPLSNMFELKGFRDIVKALTERARQADEGGIVFTYRRNVDSAIRRYGSRPGDPPGKVTHGIIEFEPSSPTDHRPGKFVGSRVRYHISNTSVLKEFVGYVRGKAGKRWSIKIPQNASSEQIKQILIEKAGFNVAENKKSAKGDGYGDIASRGAAEGTISYLEHIELRKWLRKNNARSEDNRKRDLEEELGISGLIEVFGVPNMAKSAGYRGHYAIRDRIIYIDAGILDGQDGGKYLSHEVFELIKIIKFGFERSDSEIAKQLGRENLDDNLQSLVKWLRKVDSEIDIKWRRTILNNLAYWLDEKGEREEVQGVLTAIHKAAPALPRESEEIVKDIAFPGWWNNETFQDAIWKLIHLATQTKEPLKFYAVLDSFYGKDSFGHSGTQYYIHHSEVEYTDSDGRKIKGNIPGGALKKFDEAASRHLRKQKWVITIPALDPNLSLIEAKTAVEKVLMEAVGFDDFERPVRGAAGQKLASNRGIRYNQRALSLLCAEMAKYTDLEIRFNGNGMVYGSDVGKDLIVRDIRDIINSYDIRRKGFSKQVKHIIEILTPRPGQLKNNILVIKNTGADISFAQRKSNIEEALIRILDSREATSREANDGNLPTQYNAEVFDLLCDALDNLESEVDLNISNIGNITYSSKRGVEEIEIADICEQHINIPFEKRNVISSQLRTIVHDLLYVIKKSEGKRLIIKDSSNRDPNIGKKNIAKALIESLKKYQEKYRGTVGNSVSSRKTVNRHKEASSGL